MVLIVSRFVSYFCVWLKGVTTGCILPITCSPAPSPIDPVLIVQPDICYNFFFSLKNTCMLLYQPLFKHCIQQEQNAWQKEVHLSPGREESQGLASTQGCTHTKTYKTTTAGERQRNSEMNQQKQRATPRWRKIRRWAAVDFQSPRPAPV